MLPCGPFFFCYLKEAIAGSVADSLAEARRLRRRRNLDQIEIPEDHLKLTDELLGRGGFGAVYMADYNGRNAAAKVRRGGHCVENNQPTVRSHHKTPLTTPSDRF